MTNTDEFTFLLSSDRSGSNLCLRLLDAHSDFCAPPTSQLFPVLTKFLSNYESLKTDDNWGALIEDTSELHKAGYGQWKNYEDIQFLRLANEERSLALILKTLYRAEAKAHHKSRLFVKLHKAYKYSNFLRENFPNAKYIHLVRDPRDMALSWKKTAGLRGGALRALNIWQEEQAGLIKFCEHVSGEVIHVKYEDILLEQTQTLKRLCLFLGVNYDADMLEFHRKESNQRNAEKIAAWRNLAKPLNAKNHGKYKAELSDDERHYAELKCRDEMKYFGYEFDYNFDGKTPDINAIKARLEPLEPWEKKAYADLPAQERENHAHMRRVISKIENRVSKTH